MFRMKQAIILLLITAMLTTAPVWAQEDLAKQSQNPVASLISVPFENWGYFGIGPQDDGFAYALIAKPVLPLNFGKVNLINRFIVPLVYIESMDIAVNAANAGTGILDNNVTISTDSVFGLGNIQYQAFFTPAKPGKAVWGAGPVFEFPTNTDDVLGSDRWSAGVGAVILAMPGKWLVGALVQNLWSYAGPSDEGNVNKFTFQYFVNYNLEKGWYLTMTPTITANWEADSDDRWTVPFGGGVGRLMRFGKQPVDFKLQGYWNAEHPENGPDWNVMFSVKFLFPK